MDKIKSNKKDHILEVAENVFARLGFEGASTRYLAKEAGVNMAMLNYYFGSKDGLLKAVLNRRISGMGEAFLAIREQNATAWEKLTQALDIYLDRLLGNNYYHRILHRELSLRQRSETADIITSTVIQNINLFKEIIQEGIDNGSFRQVDVEMTITNILGLNYYVTNSSHVSSRLLQVDTSDEVKVETLIKPRMRDFMHSYLKAYLMPN